MTADPLAEVLWAARERRTSIVDGQTWPAVDQARASAISAELYRRCGVADATDAVAAWKLGALDQPTRDRLGLARPLVAPVLPDGLRIGGPEFRLDLADLVQPKLEAEIGILLAEGETRLVPCIEVADCRFGGWAVPPACAVADFGLQGAMLFGTAVAPIPRVGVAVCRDGSPVAEGAGDWSDAVERLAILPERLGRSVHIATGSITPMLPATAGVWEFDFGAVGCLVVELT